MKIAIPVEGEKISAHFGHCEKFALVEIDPATHTAVKTEWSTPPAHEPGVLPGWLRQQQVDLVIAGGMGRRAQALFAEQGIQVLSGVVEGTADQVIEHYLQGTLQAGANLCDH